MSTSVEVVTNQTADAVILLPAAGTPERHLVGRSLCGVPLLVRVIAAAARAGITHFLLLDPESTDEDQLALKAMSHRVLRRLAVGVLTARSIDAEDPAHWRAVSEYLGPRCLWLPWNVIADPQAVHRLMAANTESGRGVRLSTMGQGDGIALLPTMDCATIGIHGALARADALDTAGLKTFGPITPVTFNRVRWQLVRGSGKETDGIYSRFNRWLVRPVLPFLCWSEITPNAVTMVGLLLAVLAAYYMAQGTWRGYIAGAILYLLCVLFDELDGMLARLTFRSSPLGCWLETVADYTSYLFLFAGLTLGLYRTNGQAWLWVGAALVAGAIATMWILARQRKLYTDPSKPNEFRKMIHQSLEGDSRNPVSYLARKLEFMIRKPAYCHYVLWFALLNQPKALLFLTALGANIAWMMSLSSSRLLRRRHTEPIRQENLNESRDTRGRTMLAHAADQFGAEVSVAGRRADAS